MQQFGMRWAMSDLLLLSGGIDSAALASWFRPDVCLTIDYGQRAAAAEIQASRQICADLSLRHEVLTVHIPSLGAGDMAGTAPTMHSANSEFWPFRNQYLITLGAMAAVKYACKRVLIGTVSTDDRHADGSVQFIETMDTLLALQEGEIRLAAPAKHLTTAQLVKQSRLPQAILGWTHSCHTSALACGNCRGCDKHSDVMAELGWSR